MNEFLMNKVKTSIERLQAFCPEEGYYLAFSGGKDSVVCKRLLDMSGCKYDAHYNVTSVDPPELVNFIKNVHGDVSLDIPHYQDGTPITMWNLIPKERMPPTRAQRYCCKHLKEKTGQGRKTVTGVRWAESTNRKLNQGAVLVKNNKAARGFVESGNFATTPRGRLIMVDDNEESRRMIESCYKQNRVTINPIIEWTDAEVWEFIRDEKIEYCSLYNEGFHRLGCIGCPMGATKGRYRDFAKYPKYKKMYLHAFKKMLEVRRQYGLPVFGSAEDADKYKNWTETEVFHWWMEDGIIPGQLSLFDEMEE